MLRKCSSQLLAKSTANSKSVLKFLLFFLLTFSNYSSAQPGFDDDVNDEAPAAPIDLSPLLLCVSGLAVGFYFIRKTNILKLNANTES